MKKILIVCTTDSMIWNFLVPHIYDLKSRGYIVDCACSHTGFYYDELINKYGFTLHQMDFRRSPFSGKNIYAFWCLRKLIKQENYDIIFCHEPVGGMMGRLAGKTCGKKVIYMSHGFHFFTGAAFKHWVMYYTAEYILSYFTDVCITINQEDYVRSKKMHARKCYYVHGVGIQNKVGQNTVSKNELREKLNINETDIVLISVGELSKRKNHIVILHAMEKLNNPQIKLILCGEGGLREQLEDEAKKLGILSKVIFTGFVNNVGDYLRIANIFIFPSLWEGLGMAGIEAMKVGLPVIASNRHGIKDYVIDHQTGLLFAPEDDHLLADLITELLGNESLKEYIVDNAKRILPLYELEYVKQELKAIYDKEF